MNLSLIKKTVFFFVLFGILFLSNSSHANDWPMWKADASRSGTTTEQLPDHLSLLWTRELPSKNIAWPNEPRLQYDAAHEPIVYKNQIFMAFAGDGSIRAFDTKTGRENWVFYTNGPVRFAPVAYKGHILVGSDDGFFYCLNAKSGKIEWRKSGAPSDRLQRYHLGNQKLVSFWPIRGGAVVEGGAVYFGAGIWPSMGLFIHAVDIESGKTLWTNRKSHDLKKIRLDHNVKRDVGLSPQGYLLISGDTLLIPNGRSMPAGLNKKDGSFLYYVQGYRNGDSRVITTGNLALVGETGVISVKDGREIGSRWISAGKNAPDGPVYSKVELFEGPLFPYHSVPGCSFQSAVDQGIAYGFDQGILYAYDLKKHEVSLKETEFNKRKLKTSQWKIPIKWKYEIKLKNKSNLSKQKNNTTVKAGNQIISHSGSELFAIQIPETENENELPKLLWHKTLESSVKSLVVADQKLFVTTLNNKLLVLSAKEPSRSLLVYSKPGLSKKTETALLNNSPAGDLLKRANISDGYALVLGLKNGSLVDDFLKNTKMRVIAVDADESIINSLRKKYRFNDSLNSRFQGFVQEPSGIEFPPFIANLITSEVESNKNITAEFIKKQFQALRPYGGAICFLLPGSKEGISLTKQLQSLSLPKAKLNISDGWITLHRSGSLEGSADWTHETGNASRNYYSSDELVKSPLGILWYGDAPGYGFYKKKDYAHGVKPQVAGGKLFALQGFSNTLFAVDVYTGWQVWSRKVSPSSRYASFPDKIFLASGKKCEVINTSTGNISKTYHYKIPNLDQLTTSATDIRVDKNIVLVGLRKNNENAISKGRWNNHILIAIDQTTGKQIWKREAKYRFNTAALAMSDDMVFCIDSPSYMLLDKLKRRGQPANKFKATLYTLDAHTGEVIWHKKLPNPPAKINSLHFLGLRNKDDWLVYSKEKKLLIAGRGNEVTAFNGDSGEEIWKNHQLGLQPLILQEETFFNQGGQQFEILTGKKISGKQFFKRGGCNYAVGGKHLLFLRNYCASFVDPKTGKEQNIKNLRTGCSNSFVAANGLLTMPCFSSGCICNYPLQTSFSMFHLEEMKTWPEAQD